MPMPSFSDLESLKAISAPSNRSLTQTGLYLKKGLLAQMFEKSSLTTFRNSKKDQLGLGLFLSFSTILYELQI